VHCDRLVVLQDRLSIEELVRGGRAVSVQDLGHAAAKDVGFLTGAGMQLQDITK
jgi:hypothetical protein